MLIRPTLDIKKSRLFLPDYIRLDAIVEPTRLFDHNPGDVSNQHPDIFIRNPRGLGKQVIIDVALTGIDGQSRTSDEALGLGLGLG